MKLCGKKEIKARGYNIKVEQRSHQGGPHFPERATRAIS